MGFTPGPWHVRQARYIGAVSFYVDPSNERTRQDSVCIAVGRKSWPIEEAEANARLIAAAPLMLEELEYVASGLAHIDTPWAKERLGFVQEVIKQARGEA